MPSQSPWGSTEPLVTFLTFFMFSITPDVVTLNEGEKKNNWENLSLEVKGHHHHGTAEWLGVLALEPDRRGFQSRPCSSCVTSAKSYDLPVL